MRREGFPPDKQVIERSADLRYLGQAFEVRVDCPPGTIDRQWADAVVEAFHAAHHALYGYDFRGKDDQRVEWVNLRVTGVGPIPRPEIPEIRPGADDSGNPRGGSPGGCISTHGPTRRSLSTARHWLRGARIAGPAVLQEFGSTVPVHPGFQADVDRFGNLLISRAQRMSMDPILLEIVSGTLASVEAEVETAIGRTARSPMIRDAHDFRAGIHDVKMRKLTGRSYSALVQPVVRDYPIAAMQPGDVYFHNDVYLSEGGIGHLPDLCVTVPVFHAGEVVAFVQAFGHHDDIGGTVPGSMPSHATSVFEEGLMVPPIKLWAAGCAERGGTEDHDPQFPDAGIIGGRSGRRMFGLPDGCAAVGGIVRPVRPAGDRGSLRPHSRRDHDDLPHRIAGQNPGR